MSSTKDVRIDNNQVINATNTVALGTADVNNGIVITKLSVELLKKSIEALEKLDIEEVSLIYADDCPAILGYFKDGKATGVIIAPRVRKGGLE